MPGFKESLHSWKDSEVKWRQQIWANNQLKLNFPTAVLQPKPAASSTLALRNLTPPLETSQNTAAWPILHNLPPPRLLSSTPLIETHSLKTPPSPRCPNYTVAR